LLQQETIKTPLSFTGAIIFVLSKQFITKMNFMNNNRVLLIGYVGKHLDNKKLSDGTKRTGIRMATHCDYKNNKGEIVDATVWHDVVAWDDTAEYAERNFVKGSKIMVEGAIEYRTFIDKAGNKRYHTQIKAHNLVNLDR
jgi:single-strand DNA-binding protein